MLSVVEYHSNFIKRNRILNLKKNHKITLLAIWQTYDFQSLNLRQKKKKIIQRYKQTKIKIRLNNCFIALFKISLYINKYLSAVKATFFFLLVAFFN